MITHLLPAGHLHLLGDASSVVAVMYLIYPAIHFAVAKMSGGY